MIHDNETRLRRRLNKPELRAGLGLGIPSGGNVTPALDLNFLTGQLDSRITFSRGTLATLVDSSGRITYAPNNLAVQSATFDSASWTKIRTTVTADQIAAPDGTMTADRLTNTATNINGSAVTQVVSASAGSFIASCYFKKGGAGFAGIDVADGTNEAIFIFDLSNGSASGAIIDTGFAGLAASVSDAGNGWYRCSVRFTRSATAPITLSIYAACDTIASGGATNADFNYVWGAQVEAVTYEAGPRTYNATTSVGYFGPRFDHDPVTSAAKGLLIEEQRTNLILRSAEFDNSSWTKGNSSISANAAVGPLGTTTADLLVEDSANNLHRVNQSATVVSGAAYTVSVFAKAGTRNWVRLRIDSLSNGSAWFNLATGQIGTVEAAVTARIEAFGNGWYRCSVTGTTTSTSHGIEIYVANGDGATSYPGDGASGILIEGAQMEAGSFATSYVPTSASQATRAADAATMTGTAFSNWFNPVEGTLLVEFDHFGVGASHAPYCILTDGNNFISCEITSLGLVTDAIWATGAQMNVSSLAQVQAGISYKDVLSYRNNDAARSFDGFASQVDNSVTIPVVNRITIGAFGSSEYLNGRLKIINYYRNKLPNTIIENLSK